MGEDGYARRGGTKRDHARCDGTRERETERKREREKQRKTHIHTEGERVRVYGKRVRNRSGEDGGPQSIDPPWRRR